MLSEYKVEILTAIFFRDRDYYIQSGVRGAILPINFSRVLLKQVSKYFAINCGFPGQKESGIGAM